MATDTLVKIRRMDAFPFVMLGILAIGSVAGVLVNGVHPVVPVGIFGCVVLLIAVIAYLDGPTAFVAVGPGRVVVGNSFFRYVVPRSRVADVGSLEYLDLSLVLDDGSKIPLRVFEPAMRGSTYRSPRHGRARARQIAEAIGRDPVEDDGTRTVARHVRWVNVALVLLPFAAFAALLLGAR